MENILEIVDMKDRLIDKVEDIEKIKPQDYVKAYKRLKEEALKSREFLKNSLEVEK